MSKEHHYFVSCVTGWAVAETRDEAIIKLVKSLGTTDVQAWITRLHKDGEAGVYMWSCRVDENIEKMYAIEFFRPLGVEVLEGRGHHLTYATKRKIAYTNKD